MVFGGGSWGSTLAVHLARRGCPVRLWDRDPVQRERLLRRRGTRSQESQDRFGSLSSSIDATGKVVVELPDLVEVICEDDAPAAGGFAVVAVPSHGLRSLLARQPRGLAATWVIATKGLEEETCLTMSQVARECLGPDAAVVVLAGPSLAPEVLEQKPTAILAASADRAAAGRVQALFATERFRVYTSGDPLGVEIGTALKNVVAIASGIADGLGLGQNARGALLTRGLVEIMRLGVACGARAETFLGLAGVGDLVTTCTSPLSRNYTLGRALGEGERLEAALARIGMVVEGVRTTRAAVDLAKRVQVEMPIAAQVARILFGGVAPIDALEELMARPLRAEVDRDGAPEGSGR